ncbi:hypothetical protein NA56DRAFT_646578 [Hyaloscypha hepaticicola]|uniref:Uncharacterized protein n=1 Tax=Hyaloscypha hepaticicola TaxID=2082293 RepID=A0A2J6Q167_9HELO|nr:hypothetical protein NA56DRAFT_646578 [Hyaloscypha hepaticicola]
MGDPNHPFQREAFTIFQAAWLSLQQGQHQFSPTVTDEIVEQASDELVAATVTKQADQVGVFFYSTLSAIVDHATQSPASLDLMLQAYVHAANKLPTQVSSDYGQGTQGAMGELNWWIIEEADGFIPPLQNFATGEKSSAEDHSNPQFQEREVKDRLNGVLDRAQEWRQHRVRCTLMSAAMGRCYALNLVRGSEGRNVIAFVNSALNLGGQKWSEAQFVGAAIMLRACAKSLAADTSQMSEWMQKVEALLWGDSVSFAIKSHSELLLRNLRSGPHDETSIQLFQLKDWLF